MVPTLSLLTVEEVAKLLKISPRWVAQLLREGRLKGTQLGARASWRISEEDLKDFLRSRGGQKAATPIGELVFLYVTAGLEGPEIEVRWNQRSFRLRDTKELAGFVRSVGINGFTRQVKGSGFAIPLSEFAVVGPEKIAKDLSKLIAELPNPAPPRTVTLLVHEQFPDVVADRIQRWQEASGHRPAW